ncbi:alpha-2-antiplasmin-like [Malaya genurostris]|uniref:alpha-2-antiplasmin-like n=1 Tax=Malaya genurostris TaxID=325434 RepID=UPI0026F3A32B|nr:alpha-2-antiplasmin-like [Malaya genurostris]
MFYYASAVLLLLAFGRNVYSKQRELESEFTWDFFKASFDESVNIVTSPLVVRMGMTLLSSAINDRYTLRQVREKLYLPGSITKSSEQTRRQLLVLSKDQDLVLGTKVFTFGTDELNPVFLAGTRYFDAVIEKRPQLDVTRIVTAANNWSKEVSHGLIDHVLSPQDIHANMRLLLLSAIAFRGVWQHPFDVSKTTKEFFHATSKGRRYQTDMMNLPETLLNTGIYQPLNAMAVELPFRETGGFSLVLIMPLKAEDNMTYLVQNLNDSSFKSLYNSLQPERIAVKVPRLKLSNTVNVREVFRKLQLNAPFEWSVFQVFKGEKMTLDMAKHGVSISVDESGVRAAAVSSNSLAIRSAPNVFTANRPFLYAIVKRSKKYPLFVGNFAFPVGKPSLNFFGSRKV